VTALDRVSAAAATLAAGIGGMALAGWSLDNDLLKGAGGSILMKANAAMGLVTCGLALRASVVRHPAGRWLAVPLAILGGTIGSLTLSEHIVGWNLGIDELLFVEAPGSPATASPGRMGPNGALSLMFAATAILLMHRRPRVAQRLALTTGVLALISLIGYWYGVQELYSIARYTGIALPTAVGLAALSVGIVTANAAAGPAAFLLSDGPGGVLARRLILPAIVIPPTLGYLRVVGQQSNLYDTGMGTALLVVVLVVLFTGLIWQTAVRLDETDQARATVERERDDLLLRERAARETAERANRLKDEFIATVSHELRTPLNAIVGWTQLLRTNLVSDERRSYAADVVARNGKFLARLIEDLLDVSRIATGQITLDLQPVNMVTIAHRAVDAFAASASEKEISLTVGEHGVEAFVRGDAERLQQVVNNLVSNAVKFTPAGGKVEVSVGAAPAGVELVVADSGRGIDAAFLPDVFERFRQEDATATREHGGLGLGLAIARELVHLHHGSISAFSAGRGRGARFVVSLPCTEAPVLAAHPDAQSRPEAPSEAPVGTEVEAAMHQSIIGRSSRPADDPSPR
jgi:signal transduction histidine kinase